MSEFDEMDFDEEELDALRDPEDLSPEDVFSLVMVNRVRMKKTTVHLEDEEGDIVDLPEVITELLGYMKDKMGDEKSNQFNDQIMPLISQSVVSCLGRILGVNATAFHLSQSSTRMGIIWSMCMSFLLLKYVQKHNLKIFTNDEDVDQEEIDEIDRKSDANNQAMLGMMMGTDPRETLRQLKEEGRITEDDLKDLLGDDEEEQENEEPEDEDDEEL